MSPIEYIEEGIRNGNWETVCEGYERLTGKSLPLPNTPISTAKSENALRNISDIINSFYNDSLLTEVISDERKKISKKKPRGRPKKTNKKKSTVTSLQFDSSKKTIVQRETGGIQLITNEPDPEEVKSNTIKAAKTKTAKTAIKRISTKDYNAKCNECEETFKSNRPSGEIGQKCRKCLNNNKGIFA